MDSQATSKARAEVLFPREVGRGDQLHSERETTFRTLVLA